MTIPESRTAQLDTLLAEGTKHFKSVMALLGEWPAGPELEAALVKAAPLGQAWWPSRAVADFPPDHPGWRLASRLILDHPELPDLRALPIEVLRLHRHTELPNLEDVADKAPQLRGLHVWSNSQFRSLEGLARLEELSTLSLRSCAPLTEIVELPARLTTLHLTVSGQLESLAPLAHLERLEDLCLRNHRKVENIEPLARFPHLKTLNLERVSMQDVDALSGCRALETLSLSGCRALRDLGGLRGLPELKVLALDGCRELTDLSVIESLPKLEGLSIVGLDAVEDVSRIEAMPTLTRLQRTPSLLPWPFP